MPWAVVCARMGFAGDSCVYGREGDVLSIYLVEKVYVVDAPWNLRSAFMIATTEMASVISPRSTI